MPADGDCEAGGGRSRSLGRPDRKLEQIVFAVGTAVRHEVLVECVGDDDLQRLATYVSRSPSCEYAPIARLEDIRALEDSEVWRSETDAPTDESWAIYCRARTEFERWYLHHGSADFFALLQGVARGESFDDLYEPPLTQDLAHGRGVCGRGQDWLGNQVGVWPL